MCSELCASDSERRDRSASASVAASGTAALLSGIAILFATSTTGYFGLFSFIAIQYALCLAQLVTGRATRNCLLFVAFAPLVGAVATMAIWMDPDARHTVKQLIDTTLFSKLDSASGIERASWNRQALQALRDTMGMGAGIGSVRASSWLVAVPASIGVFGALTYGIFAICVLAGRPRGSADPDIDAVQSAARSACLAQIVASSVAGSFIDLGLVFFALAGTACAVSEAHPRPGGFGQARFAMSAQQSARS
jgi:hypothetical protein